MECDLVVLGSGPGGYPAAIRAAQLGASVVVVEQAETVGGTCLNVGCIPTKAMVQSAHAFNDAQGHFAQLGVRVGNVDLDFEQVQTNRRGIVDGVVKGLAGLLKADGVQVVKGRGRFTGQNTLAVEGAEDIQFKSAVIATGSRSAAPPIPGVDHPRCIDSTGALELDAVPRRLAVLGGGVIGVEFASIYAQFGSAVTVVEMLPNLIGDEDADAVAALQRAFRRRGISVELGARATGVEERDGNLSLRYETSEGESKALEADVVLVATGRVANVEDIGLESAGVTAEPRRIPVDSHMRTNVPHIYAVGDVAANWQLAHTAFREGEVAAENALGHASEIDYRSTPRCVYTDPEIASVGLSEAQARETHGGEVVTGTMPYAAIARAAMYGDRTGFVKIIGESRYGELLGMVAVGTQATELIEAGVVAIEAEATLETVGDSIAAHPTLGEATKEAALVALGRPLHIPGQALTMRATRYLMPTLRDAPGDAVAESHKLLVRAGMIKQVGSGLWTWLPLGWRVKKRVQEIIREEMDRIGGQEMLMPVMHPAEIWKRSGRYDVDVVFRLRDRSERELVLAITHEEIVALHASQTIRSYRDLPQIWYHIQLKERDEPRAAGGVLRTREFTMKDSYTLDRDQAGLDEAYAKHEEAYDRIYTRCGLDFYKVESDTGIMGGSMAHEYMAPSSAGEDRVARCSGCDYAANVEMAVSRIAPPSFPPSAPVAEVETPGVTTIEELAQFLGIDARTTGKAMPVMAADGKLWLALVRGDRRLHELKLSKALQQTTQPATAEEIEAAFGAKPGSIGPVGITAGSIGGIIADETLREGAWVTGANRTGWHLTGVEAVRDFEAVFADLHEVEEGDGCPLCDGVLAIEPMIEIGNIFKLGTRFSDVMGAMYLDESGNEQPIVMGSYGIGPARVAAAAIEQSFDEHGCIWPAPIAPFDIWMVAIGDEAPAHADRLADELAGLGLTAMVDDREGSPGVRFADADLIGAPLRVTVGKRTVSDGTVDVRLRHNGESETMPLDGAAERIAALHASLMPSLPS